MKPVSIFMAWWQARQQRERQLMLVAAGLILAVLAATLVEWMLHERARLHRALPAAEARVAWMQEASAELAGLRGQVQPAPGSPAALADAVQASARARGFGLVVRAEADGIHLSGTVDFDVCILWLSELQRDQRLRVGKTEFVRDGRTVKLEALLVAPGES